MRIGTPPLGNRIASGLAAAAVLALFALLFLNGFTVPIAAVPQRALQLLDFTLPPPPPPRAPDPPRKRSPKPKGEAAPPNLVSRATEVVAPPPVLPVPSPVIAAKRADIGSEASSGAAPVAGPGTGAGGSGDGNGGGGGGGTPLRLLRGDITDADFPDAAWRAGASGTVGIRFTVGVNGRVTECRVTRSSGNAALDETTCRLIQKRFRYAPSRDAQGRPYADTVIGEQVWENDDRP